MPRGDDAGTLETLRASWRRHYCMRRERILPQQRARYQNDPEYAARCRARAAAYRARRRGLLLDELVPVGAPIALNPAPPGGEDVGQQN
jgi:hypothetical protein